MCFLVGQCFSAYRRSCDAADAGLPSESFISLQGIILATLQLLAAKGQEVEFRYNVARKRLGGYRCDSDLRGLAQWPVLVRRGRCRSRFDVFFNV